MIETAEALDRPSSAFRSSFANMLFKRKPVGSASMQAEPVEKEVRQRHRLSKPQTSKSSMNLAVLVMQQSASQSTVSVHSEVPMSPTASTLVSQERYISERPRPVSTVQEEDSICETDSSEMPLHGAAVVINAVENKDMDRSSILATPLQVQKPRRPFSAMIFGSRRSSNSHTASRKVSFEDATQTGEVENTSQIPSAPVELVIEGAPRVLERRSSFTPGAATRLEKVQSRDSGVPVRKPVPKPRIRKEPSYELANASQLCEADQAYYYDKARSPISPLSQIEVLDFERDWEPPPQTERSATPSDLDYQSLGGLRLGSLHVTNGRASPAPSELSRHLLHRPSALLRRDASSEYGSEVGSIKRTHTPPPSAWKRPQSRELSQSRKCSPQPKPQPGREVSYGSDYAFTAQSHANGDDLPSPTADKTVSMAISYMAEMPNSPFSPGASQSTTPVTPQRTSSPNGSVVVTTKKSEHEADLFEDETIGESQGSEQDRDTISTCRTPSDAASHRQNPFDTYNKLRDRQSQGHLQPPQDARGETSDSGYSSNASLQSMKEEKKNLVAQRVKALEQPRGESAAASLPASTQKSKDAKVVGPRPFRASLLMFHRKTAPETVPTMASLNGSTTSLATSQTTSSTFSLRPKTPSRKLQKKRRGSQPQPPEEILVAGAQLGDNSTIPPIPQHQTTNLMVRSQQFPELQRTFKSNHHTKDSAESYDQTWKKPMEIRFPSPPPDPSSDEEVRRSKSPSPKRSSFIARATRRQSLQSQRSSEQGMGGIGEAEAQAIVRHFGTTAKSLGGSPYDIARAANSRPQSRSASREGRISPHDIDVTQPPLPVPDRRRLTMDDRTASQYARSKSKSIAERDRQDSVENLKRLEHEKKTAFNGMVAMPGKRPRPHSVQPGLMTSVHRKPLEGHRPFHAPQGLHSREQSPKPAELAGESRPQSQQHLRRNADLLQQTGPWPQQQRQLPSESFQPLPLSRPPRPDQHQYMQRHKLAAPQEQQWPEEQYLAQSYQSPMPAPSRHSPQPIQEQYQESYGCPAPLPPRHSPRPSFVDPYHDMDEPTAPPPPPPSHSPRPVDIDPPADVWAAQAAAWKNRRKSVGEFLGFNSDDLHCADTDRHSAYSNDAVVEDDLDDPEEERYAVIPPRDFQIAYIPHEDHTPLIPARPSVWHPAAHHHAETYDIDLSRMTPAETFQDPASTAYDQEVYRPSPRSFSKPRSRRASGHSYASSLAESLHPSKDERPSVPPDFGRYSGGLQYGYERGKGFGGSAGTRTVSGRAQGERKGVELSTKFGVDLSDVPIVRGVRRL